MIASTIASRRCPYCNSTAVAGLGALVDTTQVVVEVRCCNCGNLFLSEDRRNANAAIRKEQHRDG